ncbi:fungal-specific transcription factor domain-containing protein [Xylogone sp. PMI_703]|nr:fungal-specific transcription factor domain-containing protein [Xylogone sp. PMI_703]
MSAKTNCWTCRLRRKRCDKRLPICKACRSLQITCYFSEKRPEWMDGGEKQNAMARRIKDQVRRSAEARREKKYVQPDDMSGAWNMLRRMAPPSDQNDINAHFTRDVETDFIMIFLDYVFPFLFPFYRPPIFDCGRAWVLALLRDNIALFHIAMSLSSYFFTLIVTNDKPRYNGLCKVYVWNKLAAHMDVAIKSLQVEMETLNNDGSSATLLHRVRAMVCVSQLMVFEGAMWRTGDWDVHLTAAVTILKGIFEEYGMTDGHPDIAKVIRTMVRPPFDSGTFGDHVWNTNQASFRFFLAVLIYTDIISSATLKRRPYLQAYHSDLMSDRDFKGKSEYMLQMENFVGCKGWALLVISNITELYIAKDEAIKTGTFDQAKLVIRSEEIFQQIKTGLKGSERDGNGGETRLQNIIDSYYRPNNRDRVGEQSLVNQIWANASKVYLIIAIEGWDLQSQSIRLAVSTILELLQAVSSPTILRSLVWPFFVAGCLAETNQEQKFRDITSISGALQAFGSMGAVLRILEKVWQKRDQLDKDWDLNACFQLLCAQILLA